VGSAGYGLQVIHLLGPLERLVANRREDLEFRRQRAQRHLEPHLVVARGGRAVRRDVRAKLPRELRHRLRLQYALGTTHNG